MTQYHTMKVRAWTELEPCIRQPCMSCQYPLVFLEVGDTVECPQCNSNMVYTGESQTKRKETKRDRQRQNRERGVIGRGRKRLPPISVLVFDTETTYDIYQNLLFGAYVLAWIDPYDTTFFLPYEEGLFYADDLSRINPIAYRSLLDYVGKGSPRPNDGKLVAPRATDWPTWLAKHYPDEFQQIYDKTKTGQASFEQWLQLPESQEWMNRRQNEYYSQEWDKVWSASIAMHEPDQVNRWLDWPHLQGMLDQLGYDGWQPDRWTDKQGQVHMWPNPPYSSRVSYGRVMEARTSRFMPRLPDVEFKIMPASAFVNDVLYEVCFPKYSSAGRTKAGEAKSATLVFANGSFDLSRLARAVKPGGPTGSKFSGGFSLRLLPTDDNEVDLFESLKHADNIRMVRRGARGTMFGFAHLDKGDRDYFTDVLNLGWSLTNQVYSLDSASRMYAAQHRKTQSPDFSGQRVTESEITYCRDDVFATLDAYTGMLREVWKHPDYYDETRAYSPAALPKAYYNDMGIRSPLERQKDFPRDVLGHSMTTFYAGRAEAHIKNVPIPVGYYDYTSMYPTVDILMGLWEFLTSDRIDVSEETEQIQEFLDGVTLDDMLRRPTWVQLRGIALLQPNEDILPVRTRFTGATSTIATAYVTGETEDDCLWWSIPDLVLSKLLTGKAPRIKRGIRFYPSGKLQDGLKPTKLYGIIPVNPAKQDFFKVAMEQRQATKLSIKKNGHSQCTCERIDGHRPDCQCEKCHVNCICLKCSLSSSLKVTANSGSYGIFAEFNQEPNDAIQHRKGYKPPKVRVYGIADEPVVVDCDKVDIPGPYAFPPIATLITGAARLMLGMLEKCVTDTGGTWASCDTDSMTIPISIDGKAVSTSAGLIPTLSFAKMDEIQARFDSLNPYDPRIAPGIHVLKREHEPTDRDPRQLHIYAISAKRYGLFRFRQDGSIEVLKGDGRKEHGLGAYLSPYNPNTEEVEKGARRHVTEIWEYLISRSLGLPVSEPSFFDLPVMCKVTISTWNSYRLFDHFNGTCDCPEHELKPYSLQIKPYNFAMSPVVYSRPSVTGLVRGRHGEKSGRPLRLIAPYERDPSKWVDLEYMDVNNPLADKPFTITTDYLPGHIQAQLDAPIQVMTWRDVAEAFDAHPEVKYCDQDGKTCSEGTRGILQRHHLKMGRTEYIGKESNRLSDRDEPLPDLADYEIPEYGSGCDDVRELALPVLQSHGLSIRETARLIREDYWSVRRYLARDDLTHDLRSDVRRIRDLIIRLASHLAVKSMNDADIDSAWRNKLGQSEHWREILENWKRQSFRLVTVEREISDEYRWTPDMEEY